MSGPFGSRALTLLTLAVLAGLAAGVARLSRRLQVPYAVALVVAGLVVGPTGLLHPPRLTQGVLYAFFLPALLFEAACHLQLDELARAKLRLTFLALPGIVVSMLVTAALLGAAARAGVGEALGFGGALVFAAIVAATDPIAVVALFKELGAPRGLRVLVEGESLLNDGTAIVLYTAALAVVGGAGMSVLGAAAFFVRVVALGVALGAAVGALAALIIRRADQAMVVIATNAIAAYGSFAVAERLGGSGVLATVTVGLFCGTAAAARLRAEVQREVADFWDKVAFWLDSLVFLLVGMLVDVSALLGVAGPIAIAYLVIVVARAGMVFLAAALLRGTREQVPSSWSTVLTWGGVRGALSMVLAIALPAAFPHRANILAMTFGVVLLSLLVQGLTMAPLLRRLGLVQR